MARRWLVVALCLAAWPLAGQAQQVLLPQALTPTPEVLVGSDHNDTISPYGCTNGFPTGVQIWEHAATLNFPNFNGALREIQFGCTPFTVTEGTTAASISFGAQATSALFGRTATPDVISTGFTACPANQVISQMGGGYRFFNGGSANNYPSYVSFACRPVGVIAGDWFNLSGVNSALQRAGGNIDPAVPAANAALTNAVSCTASATQTCNGILDHGGGILIDGFTGVSSLFPNARVSQSLTFNNYAWSQTTGASTVPTAWRPSTGTSLLYTPSVSNNTLRYQQLYETYVSAGTTYSGGISAPAAVASAPNSLYWVRSGTCTTAQTLAVNQDYTCTNIVNGRPDLQVEVIQPTAPWSAYGQQQTFTLRAKNYGPGATTATDNSTATLTLPAGWDAGTLPANCAKAGSPVVVTCAINPTVLAASSAPNATDGGQVDFAIPVLPSNGTASGTYPVSQGAKVCVQAAAGGQAHVCTIAADASTFNDDPSNINETANLSLSLVLPLPTVTLAKQSVGGTGSFAFGLAGVSNATDSIVTTASGTTVVSTTVHVGVIGTAAVITEAPQAAYTTATSCVDANGAVNGNGTVPIVSATNVATIPAANMRGFAAYTCTFTNTIIPPQANLTITKSDEVTSLVATGSTTYTIVIANAGPDAANGAVFTDPAVANLSVNGLSCGAATGGALCPTGPSIAAMQGAGIAIPTLPAGGSLSFFVTGTAGASGSIVNVASVAPPAGTVDPSPASASDTDVITAISALQSGVRTVSDNALANGVSPDVLEVYVRNSSGVAVGAGVLVSFAGTPGVAFNGGATGAGTTCTTTAASTCQVTAASTSTGPFSTSVTIGGIALGGTFTANGASYTPTSMYSFVTTPPPVVGICNADPIIAGSDFTNGAWTKSGWESVTATSVHFFNDNGNATLSQPVTGVSPGALVRFTWAYGNGNGGIAGDAVTMTLSYAGTTYWTGQSSASGASASPASTAQNSASCVSGCGALAAGASSTVVIRLPASIPLNGTLSLNARFVTRPTGVGDDPTISTPISITNTGICLVKTSVGGTGAFNFTTTGLDTNMGGGGTTATVTTAAVNTPIYYDASSTRANNQPLLVKSPGASANVTITEAPTGGFSLDSVVCSGVTPVRSGNTVTIASVPQDTLATCTFTNRLPIINLSKALGGNRVAASDNFSVAIRTGGVGGAVVSSTATATTTGSGATVNPGSGTTGDFYATAGTAFTLTEAAVGGANLANYAGSLTCTDAATVMPVGSLPANEPFDPAVGRAITPLAGARIGCAITNTSGARITLQKALGGSGRVAAADQFALSATGPGAPAAVNTTGTTTAVTSPAYSFVATPGSAYVLNEAMATGSGSALSRYNQSVTCSNAGGPTNVSGLSTLPINLTPVVGDAISCVITNTPATPAVSGRVFLDNGVGGGTANDGVLNGGESILSGVAVRLTNCAATVYASGLTDGSGSYSLAVPSTVVAGAALCVEETNLGTRVSTGASVGSVALVSGTATAATGGTYTYTRAGTPDRIAFSWNGTGHGNLNFGDVDNATFATSGAKTGMPDSTVTYAHTFTVGTAGQVSFAIAGATATPALGGWSEKIFADPGCTGSLQAGAALLYPPSAAATAVAFAGKVCIVVQEFIPATAPVGANNDAKVQASFSFTNAAPALSASYTLDDITTVSNTALDLKKEVRNVTQGGGFGVNNQAKTGETLEYRITYANNGATPISGMTVNDVTPQYTTFVSAQAGTTPASLTNCQKSTPVNPAPAPTVACAAVQAAGGTGALSWKFTGVLAPGASGSVLFDVKVD